MQPQVLLFLRFSELSALHTREFQTMTSDTHNNTGWLPNLGSYPLLNVVAVNLTIVGVLYVFYQRFLAPLARVPGPWLASITPLWRVYYIAQGDWHDKICDLHKRYGKKILATRNKK